MRIIFINPNKIQNSQGLQPLQPLRVKKQPQKDEFIRSDAINNNK